MTLALPLLATVAKLIADLLFAVPHHQRTVAFDRFQTNTYLPRENNFSSSHSSSSSAAAVAGAATVLPFLVNNFRHVILVERGQPLMKLFRLFHVQLQKQKSTHSLPLCREIYLMRPLFIDTPLSPAKQHKQLAGRMRWFS